MSLCTHELHTLKFLIKIKFFLQVTVLNEAIDGSGVKIFKKWENRMDRLVSVSSFPRKFAKSCHLSVYGKFCSSVDPSLARTGVVTTTLS